ncbi:MAG: nickel-dependent lactate racemase [Armatimonadota bacterium]
MHIDLAYGKTGLTIELPDEKVRDVLHMPKLPPVQNAGEAVRGVLVDPVGSPPLTELARACDTACIVVSDITRPVPNDVVLEPMLQVLVEAGMAPQDILILVATGLHRPNTEAELREMLGPRVMSSGCRIENHEARDTGAHIRVGATRQGTEAFVDGRYLAVDLEILTGLVEPHLMAGFSGGRKSICPGTSSAETIMAFHRPELMEDPAGVAGNMQDNPVDLEACDVAGLSGGADFIVNVTLDEERNVTGVFGGGLFAAHHEAVQRARQQTTVTINEPADIVITTGGGYPLDLTFYQGIKGMVAAGPVVKDGGTVIIAQQNAEGIGGEEFQQTLLESDDIHELIREALDTGRREIDLWQVHKLELLLRRVEIFNYSTGVAHDLQQKLFVTPVASVEEAVADCIEQYGPDAAIAVIPHGPYVLAQCND